VVVGTVITRLFPGKGVVVISDVLRDEREGQYDGVRRG
jgi:hypothetical protein